MANRDIVVIGASAGGLELLLDLVAELPVKLPASLFVVLHTAAGYLSSLPELLTRRGSLPAAHPTHGDKISPGRISRSTASSAARLPKRFDTPRIATTGSMAAECSAPRALAPLLDRLFRRAACGTGRSPRRGWWIR